MRVIFTIIVILIFSFVITAENKDKRIGKTYWLKHNLIFLNMGYNPNVYPNDIFFADGCDQIYLGSSRILNRGVEVQLTEFVRTEKYAKVTMKTQNDTYNLVLHENWSGSIEPSFKLIFSQKEMGNDMPANCAKDLKTKKEMLRCLGFPMTTCKTGDEEKHFYTIEFVGRSVYSYDTWTITTKGKRVIGLSGTV